MQDSPCWGCGTSNADGLHVRSYWSGDEAVCTWQPRELFTAGTSGILNGGIIATVIGCHSTAAATAHAYQAENRPFGSDPRIQFVTALLQVRYLRPTSVARPVTLRARVGRADHRRTVVHCSVLSDGVECARGELEAVRVGAGHASAINSERRSD